MDRRNAMKILLSTLTVGAFTGVSASASFEHQPLSFGALKPTRAQRRRLKAALSFHKNFAPLRGIAKKDGKNVFLWKNLELEIGEIVPHDQTGGADGTQGEGDCLGHAAAMGCDVLAASDIHYLNQSELWYAKASVEAIYWGSRIEIGKDRHGADGIIKGSGSVGTWAAEWLKDYGVLHRQEYRSGGNIIDLTGYSPERSRERRNTGVPDWLEPIARTHPVLEMSNLKTGQEALDAICAGQPGIFCSSYKFHRNRDEAGFTLPYVNTRWKWNRRRRKWVPWNMWFHAMIGTGALLEGGRVGVLFQNSHGAWNHGPRPYDLPVGGFFVDLKYVDIVVKDWNDCWAISGYAGHSAKRIRKHLLYLR